MSPSSSCTSALYEGLSKSDIEAKSACAPLCSRHFVARFASFVLSEPVRSDAEKMRTLTGARTSGAKGHLQPGSSHWEERCQRQASALSAVDLRPLQ